MKNGLLMRLVLPLLLVSFASIIIHIRWQAGGFFLNLATEIIGILITLLYVDWIIRQRERKKWLGTDERISNRLRILLNSTVSGIRDGLGFDIDILDQRVLSTLNPVAIHDEIMRVGKSVIAPIVHQRVSALDQRGWKSLTAHLVNAHNGALAFLTVFQTRLSPDQISDLLDLQEALEYSLTFYSIFPEMAGVPEDELPETRTPPEILQKSFYENTANDIVKILALSKKLSQSVATVNPGV